MLASLQEANERRAIGRIGLRSPGCFRVRHEPGRGKVDDVGKSIANGLIN